NLEQAVQSCLGALQSGPGRLDIHSNLLFSCNYLPHESGAALLEHARRYGAAAEKRARPYLSWSNTPDPARQLRIGLVSADLRRHPVGYFLEDVLAALHREHGASLAFHAYANSLQQDELSRRLQAHCAAWHTVFGMSDEQLARLIHGEAIDILIDLSGHTTGTRLPMFAWKPAPLQISWLGYFATTGLAAIDYFVADPWALPPGDEADFSEAVWRLPETRLCLGVPDCDLAPSPLPALARGHVTFGCCNGASKLGEEVIALWARILHAVPASRLLLKNLQFSDPSRRADMQGRFASRGIAPERLLLEGPSPREEYLRTYERIDIALDPFPYPGGTTTAEALWMGVPVLTLSGRRFLARQGVGLLANAGLPGWIAADAEDYLAKAIAAAADLPALARLRAGLRAQVLASPLFDAPRFAGHFETMLREMWRDWCQRRAKDR
ncbi:MAG TPA: peptide-binding protein, partial [Burkholderiaceae bacterium]